MVTKRKKSPTRRKRTTRKPKKTPWFPKIAKALVALLFLGFVSLSVYFLLQNKTWSDQGLSRETLEGIFLAADVQPDTDIVRKKLEDGERWLVHLDHLNKRQDILGALKKVLAGYGQNYTTIDKSKRGNNHYLLIKVPLSDGTDLKLIFQVPAKPSPKPKAKPRVDKQPEPKVTQFDKADQRPKVVIILDDIGHKRTEHLKPVLDLRYPITFAVLPYLKYTKANAIYLHQNQYEVILHMPMEPGDYPRNNPGKGAILSHLNDGEIRHAMERALKDIPFIVGVNNHMGSKVTSNRTLMRSVLSEVKKNDLFFIDSRTHKNSVAFDVSRDMGLTSAKRDVFLDSKEDFDFSVNQMKQARRIARQQGLAIVIGHPYPSTLQALVQEMPKMETEGFQFVFASKVVRDYSESL